MTVNVALNPAKAITAFNFSSPAATGVINETTKTVALTVPYGTDVTALVPTITHTGASISPDSGVVQNFTGPVTYTVTAADSTTQNYTVTVTVAPNPAKAITAFNFASPAVTGVVNETAKTVALTVPYGTDITALVPTITHTGASISPNSGIAQNFSGPVIYTVTAADSTTQAYTITVTVAPNPAKAITVFNFSSPAATGMIDEINKTVAVTVPYGTDVTALVPTITHTGASVSPNSGVAQNFTNPVTYTVTAADSTTQAYTVTVTVAPASSKAITAFNFSSPAVTGVIDEGLKTISLTVPYNTDVTALVPTITHTGASVAPNSGVAQNFLSPVSYTVTAADLSTQAYTVTVTAAPAPVVTAPTAVAQILKSGANSTSTVQMNVAGNIYLVKYLEPAGTQAAIDAAISGNKAFVGKSNAVAATPYTVTLPAGLIDGVYDIVGVDAGGNVSAILSGWLTIDNTAPTVVLSDNHPDSVVYQGDTVIFTATFTESGQIDEVTSPKISINSLVTNAAMTKSDNLTWLYTWNVPAGNYGLKAITISATDLAGNPNAAATGKTSYTVSAPKAITQFDFSTPPVVGVINEALKTVALTVPYGTDVTSLVPTITHTGVSISPNPSLPQNFTSPVTYTVTGADSVTQDYTVTVTVALNPAKAITAFSFASPAAMGSIDEGLHTISVVVPFGTDISALVPTIAHTGASIAPDPSIAQDFNTIVYYTVTAADSTTQAYSVTVTKAPAPIVSAPTSVAEILKGGANSTSTVQMNVAGNIYLVKNQLPANTQAEIDAAISGNNAFIGKSNAVANTPYTITVAAGLFDGVYDIVGVDAAGNVSAILSGWLTVDNTAPTVVLSDDHPDDIVRDADTVVITATFAEADQMSETSGAPTIQIGGLINAVMTKQSNLVWTYTWNVPAGNDGIQTIIMYSTDRAGNANTTATGKTSYTIDNTGPSVALSDNQSDAFVMFGDTVQITATFTDADQIDETASPTITIGSDVIGATMTKTSNLIWTYTWAVPSAVFGDQTVSITAYDRTGNANSPATGRTSYTITAPKAITAFDFANPAALGVINEGAKTISLTVPSGTNLTSLVPTITHTGISISPDTGIAQNFSNSVIYTVTAADSSTQAYTVTVTAQSYNMSISSFAGVPPRLDGTGAEAVFYHPEFISIDSSGVSYVSEDTDHTIRKITAAGIVTTFAGSAGSFGSTDGTGASARFKTPCGSHIDSLGNLYVADSGNHTIRKITSDGVVTTFAGTAGSSGITDGTGSEARFNYPRDVTVDSSNNVYVADTSNHTIRKITPGGVVTTIAGTAGISGSIDGNGIAASFNQPYGVDVDSAGNLFVADKLNHTIRKIDTLGNVTTFAGTAGLSGITDATGASARFNNPCSLELDASGNVYVTHNFRIRKITSEAVVTTFAGSGVAGSADGIGTSATFNVPTSVAVDNSGNLYVADQDNGTIRKITPAAVVTTFAGAPYGTDGTGANARFGYFNYPRLKAREWASD